ncbi:threonine/serine exporter family protein [soil metagenome]
MTLRSRLTHLLLKPTTPESALPAERDADAVLAMLSALGIGMLETGQPTSTVRDRLRTIGTVYGMPDVDAIVLPTSLVLKNAGRTEIAESNALGSRLDQAGAIDSLIRRAELASVDPTTAVTEATGIRESAPRFGWFATLVGTVLLTVGFGLMLNPAAAALPAYVVLGAVVGGLLILSTKVPTLATLVPIASAFIVTLATVLYLSDAVGADALHVIAPALISFLPGLTITVAAMELTSNQVVAGASRLVYGIAQLLLLAFGVLAATIVTGATLASGTSDTLGAWAPWIGVILVGIGYVLQQSAPRGALLWILVTLVVAYGVQSLVGNTLGAELSGFAAAAVVVPFAELATRFRGSPPARVMTLATFWMLVPGALGFIGVDEAATSDGGLTTIMSTAVARLEICLCVLVGTGFTVESGRLRRRLGRNSRA